MPNSRDSSTLRSTLHSTLPSTTAEPEPATIGSTAVASSTVPEQAAQWHVLLHSEEATDTDRSAFADWLLNNENAEAYRQMEAIWAQFDALESPPATTALKQSLRETRKQRGVHRATGLGVVVLSVLVALMMWQYSPLAHLSVGYLLADYTTGVGEQQRVILDDGSQLILNTASAVNVDYSEHQRTLYLVQGEIQLDVAHDARRPLVVVGKQGSARALGTQFSVRNHEQVTEVVVTESRVEVCVKEAVPMDIAAATCRTLHAGERTEIDSTSVKAPQAQNAAFASDWVQQQLIVDNQPLLDVLDELARYHSGYLYLDRAALVNYRISGVFPLDNTVRSLQVIATSLPVSVKQHTGLLTIVTGL